jgi:hypothetical protein
MGNKNTKYKDLDNIPVNGKLSINGDNYIGGLVNNIKNGNGIMEFFNGDIYDGDWVNDEMHGKGKYQFENGDIYIGEMKNNYRHGKGEMSYANGYSVNATFSFNKIIGNGVYYGLNKIKLYVGEFKNDIFHGKGKLYHETKTKFYSGQFINGICHGYGKLYNPEGKILYSGGVNNGELDEEIKEKNNNEISHLIEDYNNFIYTGCLKNLEEYFTFDDNISDITIVEAKPIPSAPNFEIWCIICNKNNNLINFDCGHKFICKNCLVETQVDECFECGQKFNRNNYIY